MITIWEHVFWDSALRVKNFTFWFNSAQPQVYFNQIVPRCIQILKKDLELDNETC